MNAELVIREEVESDVAGVRSVNLAAFETAEEADLVDRARRDDPSSLSLVAVADSEIIGHLLFTRVVAESAPELLVMGLGPMAVIPGHQRRGVGTALVRTGLELGRAAGWLGVVVVGHPSYYPRFGFRPGSELGLVSQYDVPDEVFMALETTPGSLRGAQGVVRYGAVFS